MPKKVWNGKGMLSQGVEVRFATRVGLIRRQPRPNAWPPPAADLKKEDAGKAQAALEDPDDS